MPPNKPQQPTSGGHARGRGGSMGVRRSRLSGRSLARPEALMNPRAQDGRPQ
jgi:hypothetical protein